jgi:hypothetical protein
VALHYAIVTGEYNSRSFNKTFLNAVVAVTLWHGGGMLSLRNAEAALFPTCNRKSCAE